MRRRLSVNGKPVLWWLAPMALSTLVLSALNASATSLHPVGRVSSFLGAALVLLTMIFGYHLARLGTSHPATRLSGTLTLAGLVGLGLRWVPAVAPIAALAACAVAANAVRSSVGRRELVLLVVTLAASVTSEGVLLAGLARYMTCDPKHRWVCELKEHCFSALLVAAVVVLCAFSRSLVFRGARTPAAA